LCASLSYALRQESKLAATSRAPLFTRVKIQMNGALHGSADSASHWKNDAPFCQPHVLQFMPKDFTGGREITALLLY